jgi:uncharacterized membrane protein HdeD (DUF308 family)
MAMIDLARQVWRWMVIQGTLTLLFGVAVSIWPDSTIVLLLILFAFSAIGGGLASLVLMFSRTENILAVVGLGLLAFASLALGVVAVIWPQVAAVGLLIFIILQALFAAIFLIILGIRVRQDQHSGGWWALIPGIAACALVPVLLIWRAGNITGPGDVLGAFAAIEGIIVIVGGFLISRELPGASQATVAAH